jgi:ankyrin repeat protein
LQRASELGHAEVIKALLEDGRIDPNWTPVLVVDPAIFIASEHGHAAAVKVLLSDSRLVLSRFKKSPFWEAARAGYLDVLREFILSGREIDLEKKDSYSDHEFYTPLEIATKRRNNEVVMLLEALALNQDAVRMIISRFNVSHGIKDNTTWSERLLYEAAKHGRTDEVRALFTLSDIDINWGSDDFPSPTPLQIACKNGHTEVVSLLLSDPRIDVDKTENKYVSSPLYLASKGGHVDTVKLLLADFRIDPEAGCHSGQTPLWEASRKGHVGVVRAFLASRRKIDVHREGHWGSHSYTPAEIAPYNAKDIIFVLGLFEWSPQLARGYISMFPE